MLKVGHVVKKCFGHVVRNVEGWSCSSFVVALLLRNVEGWSCSSFVKKC